MLLSSYRGRETYQLEFPINMEITFLSNHQFIKFIRSAISYKFYDYSIKALPIIKIDFKKRGYCTNLSMFGKLIFSGLIKS